MGAVVEIWFESLIPFLLKDSHIVQCGLACDKMCEVYKMFRYRLDSGSVILTDDGTHFGCDVGPF